MNKYIVEFIGTFFLVLVIGLTVSAGSDFAPLAIGSTLMVMIFAGGHISGAHYNPAVTLAVFLRGKCDAKDIGPYMIAQVLGAVLAALSVAFLRDAPLAKDGPIDLMADLGRVVWAEVLFTFALAYVILNVATAKGTEGNSFYGLAIGFTVLAGAYTVGPVSGGVFNPAVAVGICRMGLAQFPQIWIYLVAQFAAAAVATVVFAMAGGLDGDS